MTINKLFVNCESCCQAVAKLSTKPQWRGWIISVGKWHRLVHWKYDCILFLALQPKLFLFLCLLKVWQILRLLSRQLKVREHFAFLLRLEIFRKRTKRLLVWMNDKCLFYKRASIQNSSILLFGFIAKACLHLICRKLMQSRCKWANNIYPPTCIHFISTCIHLSQNWHHSEEAMYSRTKLN